MEKVAGYEMQVPNLGLVEGLEGTGWREKIEERST
jgi:hypothetical protein